MVRLSDKLNKNPTTPRGSTYTNISDRQSSPGETRTGDMHVKVFIKSMLESSKDLKPSQIKFRKTFKETRPLTLSSSQSVSKMARLTCLCLSTLLSFVLTFRSVLSHPVLSEVSFESTPSLSQYKRIARGLTLSPSSSLTVYENTTGWTWFYVSGDGSQILPIKGP